MIERHFLDPQRSPNSGVVDNRIKLPKFFNNGFGGVLPIFFLGNVLGDEQRPFTEAFLNRFSFVFVTTGEGHPLGAFLQKQLGDG